MKSFRKIAFAAAALALAAAAHAESYTWLATIDSVAATSATVASPWGSAKPGDVMSGRLVSNSQGTTLVTDTALDTYDYVQSFSVSTSSGGTISYKVNGQTMQTTPFSTVTNNYRSKNNSATSITVSGGSYTFCSTVSDAMYTPHQFATGDVWLGVGYPVADNTPWSNAYKFGYPSNLSLSDNPNAPTHIALFMYTPSTFTPTSDYYMLSYTDNSGNPLIVHIVNGQSVGSELMYSSTYSPPTYFRLSYNSYVQSGKTVPKQFKLTATLGALTRVQ